MNQREKIYEKYKKSDIFNLSSTDYTPAKRISHIPYLSNTLDISLTAKNKENSIMSKKKAFINQRKYVSKHHESDIFNLNKTFQPEKINKIQKRRNAQNYSTCFDGIKDNAQFAKDIKEYTKHYRKQKTDYNPYKYFHEENAKERLYTQFYDRSRNPIINLPKKGNSMMKSSANLFSQIKIDINNNTSDKIKLEKDVENAFKTHKFYKTKGFTYIKNDGLYGNAKNNKFILTENNQNNNISNCKINKQLQLQSNIFNDENIQKNENNINKIKQRIKLAEDSDENKPKKHFFINNKTPIHISGKSFDNNTEDKNIWGAKHNNWEKSNMDWIKDKTEIIFNKNNGNKDINITAFQRKMNQLADSNNKDTISESIKVNRKDNQKIKKEKYTSNLEQIDEILNDIPDNVLKYDKKKKILYQANTIGLNGEPDLDKNILNYNKFHTINTGKKNQTEPTIKIMSKESQNHFDNKKQEEKKCNLKNFDDYNIHDFILSYDTRTGPGKNEKNNFDRFSDNEVKLLFSKNGVHIYDIKKNMFNNGKYNVIKFKVRENEGEEKLNEKMKEIETIFNKKDCKISIKKDEEKNLKKNLRNVAKAPFTKRLIFTETGDSMNNSNLNDKNKNKTFKRNAAFSNKYGIANNNYKNHYKEEQLKNKVNK